MTVENLKFINDVLAHVAVATLIVMIIINLLIIGIKFALFVLNFDPKDE